jgi:ABC-type lipoprotein release transport system permease subunit
VKPADGTTFAVVVVLLLLVVLLACAIPAVRATRADPVESMRAD